MLAGIVAAAVSLPLFCTYAIKHTLFPPGYLFVALYSTALVSVVAVPIVIAAELVLVALAMKRKNLDARRWHVLGLAVAALAEIVFLVCREL